MVVLIILASAFALRVSMKGITRSDRPGLFDYVIAYGVFTAVTVLGHVLRSDPSQQSLASQHGEWAFWAPWQSVALVASAAAMNARWSYYRRR